MSGHNKTANPLARLTSSFKAMRERHSERHRPTGFRFAFAEAVDFLHPQHWDNVTSHSGIFLRRDILWVIEDHGSENVTPRYALIFRGGKPVGAVAAQMVQV